MKICQSNKFNPDAGEWCVLTDYGIDGLSVSGQYDSIEEAIAALGNSEPQVIVRLVDFKLEVCDGR